MVNKVYHPFHSYR